MQPLVKVLIIVAIVLVVIHIIKQSMGEQETYVSFSKQEFETVPPTPFVVTPVPLVVNQALSAPTVITQVPMLPTGSPMVMTTVPTRAPVMTEVPLLTEVSTQLPSIAPAMVPTAVPVTTVPIVPRAMP